MTMLPPNVIMTNIKYLLAINERNSTPEAVYICLRTKKKGIPWNDDWIKNLYELRSRVHPSGYYVDRQRREVPTLAPSVGIFTLIQSLKKMATPSQSRSSGRGEDDNFEWRLAIERRQLASERQLKALLQETEKLREENAVLRIQASTSGPPRHQRSRGQVANSRPQQEPESIYPGTTGVIPGACNVRPHEPRTPMP
ncbi:hypothetical protein CK203_048907 [Vitis vinifera]|nr:hypothetical protein CK203_048907 [Vitis vinifera]